MEGVDLSMLSLIYTFDVTRDQVEYLPVMSGLNSPQSVSCGYNNLPKMGWNS